MKTLKKIPLELVEVEFIPAEMQEGKFYYSKEYQTSNHLCVCGCGEQAPIPIKQGEWAISLDSKGFSVWPSILQRFDCKSHYIIKNGVANIV